MTKEGYRGTAYTRQPQTHSHILATRLARVLKLTSAPKKYEGAGNAGCPMHPWFRAKNARGSATGSPVSHRHSLRSGFTVSFALSRVTGLSCHPRPREALASQELDASVGASGPHDFAVRQPAVRPRAESARRRDMRPPHPVPTFVTMADVPLFRNRTHRKGN